MSKRNPTSDIRGGLIYEEAWGLFFCAQWMNKPDLYNSIWFQTTPDEAGSGRFYLDDIVIRTSNNQFELYQIKHHLHPEKKEWEWADLYSVPKPKDGKKSKATSLLKKWSGSLFRVMDGGAVSRAALLTNGQPSDQILKYLVHDKIDGDKLKAELPDTYQLVEDEIGAERIAEFFALFEFRFNQDGLSPLEEKAKQVLGENLRATSNGIKSLILELRAAFASEFPKPITLEQLRQWCEFDTPRHLNERFEIPDDYQWFDETIHSELLQQLEDKSGGVKVIVGSPGSGKSTTCPNCQKYWKKRKLFVLSITITSRLLKTILKKDCQHSEL